MKPFLKELVVHMLVACLACQSIYAQAPQWWNDAGLISENLPADDFAPLNAGQLKFMAWKAAQQMNSRLPGGAGGALNQMVESWLAPENLSSADDYSAATLGQLRAVAAPIYQRLSDAGLAVSTPWTETADDDDDHAVANTGQAKRVFSFELPQASGSPLASGDGESDPVHLAGATVAASPPPIAAPALTLDTTIQYPGVYYYGNESYECAQAIGYSGLPQDTTHRYYAGARAKHEFKIPSWTHNKSLTHEARNTKGSKLGSYYKINTTSVETGTHVETYNVDWSGTCTNPIVTTTEAEQASGLFSPQFFQQRGSWREKLVCSVKQVHTSRHEYKGVTNSSTWSNYRLPIYPDNIEYFRAKGDELRTYVETVENKINHEASGVDDNAIYGVTAVAGMNFNWPNSDKIQAKQTEDLTYRYNWQWKIPGPGGILMYHPKVPLKSPGYPKDSKKNLKNLSGQSAYPVKSGVGTTEPTRAPFRAHCTYLKLQSTDGPTVETTETQTKQTYDVIEGTDRKKVPGASHVITLNRDNPILPSAVKQEFMSYLAGKAWQGWVRDTENNAPTGSHYSMVDKAPNNAGYYAHSGTKLAWALAYQVPTSYTSAQRDALRPASTTVTYYHYSPTWSLLNSASTSYLLYPGDTLTPALVNASQSLPEGGLIAVTTQTSYLSIDIKWEAKPDFANVDDNPDPWQGGRLGKRIFPDALTPNGSMRRQIKVQVNVPGHANGQIFLKVFDVDDPSAISDPTHELDATDVGGNKAGNDNIRGAGLQAWPSGPAGLGLFVPQIIDHITVQLDSNGLGQAELMVDQQPGNNYRIAAAFKESDLDYLQVSNSAATGYVAPDDAAVAGFRGAVTQLLTVWRRLNIEVDSMNWYQGVKPSPDRILATSTEWKKVGAHNYLYFSANLPEGSGFYTNGKISSGGPPVDIVYNDQDYMKTNPEYPTTLAIGLSEIVDDDDSGLTGPVLPKSGVISQGVKDIYKRAYIDIVERQDNVPGDAPFDLYSKLAVFGDWSTPLDDTKNHFNEDGGAYWTHYLMVAYQPPKEDAGDPDGPGLEGVTQWGLLMNTEYSAIFVETIRDSLEVAVVDAPAYQNRQDEVVAHEIGHVPRRKTGHPELRGLMAEGAPEHDFSAESLLRFRKTPSWQVSW